MWSRRSSALALTAVAAGVAIGCAWFVAGTTDRAADLTPCVTPAPDSTASLDEIERGDLRSAVPEILAAPRAPEARPDPRIPTVRIAGRVLDEDGRPCEGWRVAVKDAPGRVRHTDRQGRFAIEGLEPRAHVLLVRGVETPPLEPGEDLVLRAARQLAKPRG